MVKETMKKENHRQTSLMNIGQILNETLETEFSDTMTPLSC